MPIVRRPPLPSYTLTALRLACAGVSLWAIYAGVMHYKMTVDTPGLTKEQMTPLYVRDAAKFAAGLFGSLVFGYLARFHAAYYDDKEIEFQFHMIGIPTSKLKIQIDWITRFNRMRPGKYEVFYKMPYGNEICVTLRGEMADAEQFLRTAKIGRRQPPPSQPPMGP